MPKKQEFKTLQCRVLTPEALRIFDGFVRRVHERVIQKRVIEKSFPDCPFTIYTFRHTCGTRHSQAWTALLVLSERMGQLNAQTTMIYVRAVRKQEVEATAKLQAFVEAASKAKQLPEQQEAEKLKPPVDEWEIPSAQVKRGPTKSP